MIHIFDGATGTMLQAAGLKAGECPELVNLERPAMMRKIHKTYIEAGATILETNTFGGCALKLEHYGLAEKAREINIAAVHIAKEAAAGRAKIAGSMGPTGRFIEPLGDLDFEAAYQTYFEQAAALEEGGADYILIETSIDIQETRAALLAAKEATKLPVICQLSYSEDGRTVTGTDPETAAVTLDALGADIIGVNCSLGPEQLLPVVRTLAASTNKPVSVQPNAGLPQFVAGKTIFPMGPEDFARWVPDLIAAGATYLGGCCGTTPEHIRAIAAAAAGCPEAKRPPLAPRLRLTSRSQTTVIDASLPPVLIGERINPTGRKKLAAEIKDGSLLAVKKEAIAQSRAGARVLDVNMGVAGIDQAAAMKRAVREISQITTTPLALDTSDAAALEAGLRIYPGRALINSVSAEPERIARFLPLAKKYGAAILCLPLTENGVPKTAEERVAALQLILDAARKEGLTDGDFLLDGLVMTVAAEPHAAGETLNTLRLYRKKFGYPATMGLSNISYGLPNRPLINSTFFAMCLAAGLDAPIMNPYDEEMQRTLIASAALLGHDPNGRAYAKKMAAPEGGTAAKAPAADLDPIEAIKSAVKDGAKEMMDELVTRAVKAGIPANDITEKALTAAMNEIGEGFGAGTVFLPEVLLSAEAMKTAFDKLSELLPAAEKETRGTVILATVKGDVHDLGKNIVGALLSNSGFTVIDLGKDVPSADIIRAAKEHDADIVGLSALMTTTMIEIDQVVNELRAAKSRAHIIVGGAAVTEEYAREAGADYYAPDGVAAVRIARRITEKQTLS